jgi:RpiR family carbohydrate utilization transcriptional regulator
MMQDSRSKILTEDGDLLTRIQERYGSLRKSERIVADHLRAHPGQRLDSSITEFSRRLGVSEATISRVSRALGYEGFQDMKLSLAEEMYGHSAFANIPTELDENDTLITTGRKLANTLAASLQETHKLLDGERIQKVVDAIEKAEKLVFVGVGGAAAICDEAVHLFLKAGIDASSYGDGYTQTIAAATMSPSRIMIGVSHTGRTQTVANALELARRKGSFTVAITSDPEAEVARAAEVVLVTSHHDRPPVALHGDFLEGRICQLFLIDLLYLGLLFRSREGARKQLKATTRALERYYQRPPRQPTADAPRTGARNAEKL